MPDFSFTLWSQCYRSLASTPDHDLPEGVSSHHPSIIPSTNPHACTAVSRRTLLVYRLACLGYALFIGIRQYLDRGSIAFVYYTGAQGCGVQQIG